MINFFPNCKIWQFRTIFKQAKSWYSGQEQVQSVSSSSYVVIITTKASPLSSAIECPLLYIFQFSHILSYSQLILLNSFYIVPPPCDKKNLFRPPFQKFSVPSAINYPSDVTDSVTLPNGYPFDSICYCCS